MAFHKNLFFYIPPIFLYSYLHSFIFFCLPTPSLWEGRGGFLAWVSRGRYIQYLKELPPRNSRNSDVGGNLL